MLSGQERLIGKRSCTSHASCGVLVNEDDPDITTQSWLKVAAEIRNGRQSRLSRRRNEIGGKVLKIRKEIQLLLIKGWSL